MQKKHYINTSAEIAMQVSAILSGDSSIKFSGVIKGSSATITVSGAKNAEMVNRIIENVRNADILNELAQAGFERMPDSNNFVVIRNMSTGETAGFKNMAMVRNMWNDRSNEFFHAPVYAVDKAAENAEPFYISDTDGFEEIGVYVDETGTAPTFPTEEAAEQYAESNNIPLSQPDVPVEHIEEAAQTPRKDGIIDINRDLIDSFDHSDSNYANVFTYDDREEAYSWIAFDDSIGEDGILIEKFFNEEDVFEAYKARISAETEAAARNAFISVLNDRATERRYTVSDPEFTECAERYIHLPVRGEALSAFAIYEGSKAVFNVEHFIEFAEKNCAAVREDKVRREQENAKNAVVDACYDKVKAAIFEDEAVKNALENSSYEEAHNIATRRMNDIAMSVFNEDARGNIDFYIDFFGEKTTAKNIDFIDYVTKIVRQSIETRNKTAVFSENDDIIIDGKEGTWHVAATAEIHGRKLYELESDTPEVGHIIVDGRKKVVSENVQNGFVDVEIPSKPEMAFYIKNNDEYIAATNNHMTVSEFLELFANTEYKDLFKMLDNNGVMTNEIRFAEVSQSQNGIGVEVDLAENKVTVIGTDTLVTLDLDDVRDKYYNSPVHFGLLGNGITVYDTSREANHDYPIVAHISEEGVIHYYDRDNIGETDIRRIEKQAAQVKQRFADEWNKLDNVVKYDKLLKSASAPQIEDIVSLHIPSAEVVKVFEHSINFDDVVAYGNEELDDRNPDEVAKALDLYRNHITFCVITIEGEKPVVSSRTYVDREDITELDEYQEYILRTGKKFADVTVEYYDIGNDIDNESYAAEDGDVIYIQEHLDDVINHTGCIILETNHFSVETPEYLLEEYSQAEDERIEAERQALLPDGMEYINDDTAIDMWEQGIAVYNMNGEPLTPMAEGGKYPVMNEFSNIVDKYMKTSA